MMFSRFPWYEPDDSSLEAYAITIEPNGEIWEATFLPTATTSESRLQITHSNSNGLKVFTDIDQGIVVTVDGDDHDEAAQSC
jgi:endoglucanase Acf2